MVSDESREENASECRGLHSPVKLSGSVGGGGTGAVHVEVRTRRMSLGELAVAKRAREAGLGAPEGFVWWWWLQWEWRRRASEV
jgi:hypothetical protein